MKMTLIIPAMAGSLLALSGAAMAATTVTATTDLNVRAGPGPQYPIVGVLAAGQATTLKGCLENSKWCSVAEAGGDGWVFSDYLSSDFGGKQVILTDRPAGAEVSVIAPPADKGGGGTGAVVGGATGAIAGAIIGGPAGAAIGGAAGVVAGGATGQVVDPPEKVRSYVTSHKIDPVYLDGEVVVGAGLPDTVQLAEIPDYKYRYVYVNGQPVLVDRDSRRIVYVMR